MKSGFTETAFVDDLKCWKAFRKVPCPAQMPLLTHGPMLSDLRDAQRELHLWGQANQVSFDPKKESFHILH